MAWPRSFITAGLQGGILLLTDRLTLSKGENERQEKIKVSTCVQYITLFLHLIYSCASLKVMHGNFT